MNTHRLPVFFLSHGGGPWPWMKEQTAGSYDQLEASLARLPSLLETVPKAVLMVSAHWEEREFTVMSNPRPGMIYDYSGFPEHTYRVKYEAPGSPAVAQRVQTLISAAGIDVRADPDRGFDHGTYSPLAVVFPDANVAVLQLSLKHGLDAEQHLAAGRALAPLRDEGVLIVGSGLSYHDLRAFGAAGTEPSATFDRWLQDSLIGTGSEERAAELMNWQAAPAARQAHPREEHLLPLMVAAGAAADDMAHCVYHEDRFLGAITVSSFQFGGAPH